MKSIFKKNKRGFTIFFAMLVSTLALSVGLAIFDLTIRELDLSATATQSQFAIYAADTGADCALYWDFKYTDEDGSAFGTSTESSWPASGVVCNSQDITESDGWNDPANKTADSALTTFSITVSSPMQTYCAEVEVYKETVNDILETTIISRGYNTCTEGGPVRVERALQISY
jgi:hypothetical protein